MAAVLARCFGLLVLSLLIGCSAAITQPTEVGTVIEPPVILDDFSLPSSDGGERSLSEFRGKAVAIFFGYTFCPDICPLTMSELQRAHAELGDQAEDFQVLFISVDGERDTPEVLARYMSAFEPSFIGLQGDPESLAEIGRPYGLYYELQSPEGTSAAYLVDHSSAVYLIDPQGQLRTIYRYGTEPSAIAAGVRRLLAER